MRRRGNICVVAGAAVALACSVTPAPALAIQPAAVSHAVDQTPAEVRAYWTAERMREAESIDLPGGLGAPGAPLAAPSAQSPDREIDPGRDTAYPERIHGKLFLTIGSSNASCSATVVTSFIRNLLLTAGHCVVVPSGPGPVFAANVLFVPGYRNDARPFGVYPATRLRAPAIWAFEGDITLDVGTVNLAPGPGGQIQDVLGSRGVSFNRPARGYRGTRFQIFGYPALPAPFYDGERPILCSSRFAGFERFSSAVLASPCHQQEGSSGGGWVVKGGLVNSVVSHSGCVQPGPACEVIAGPYLGDAAFKLWSGSAGGLPTGRRKRLRGCKRKSGKKRTACLVRAQTFRPVVR
ncbi:MAG TPA: hypothetical protein VHH72_09100 [Solirubrobacterales bacterium]|jgi:hypothetical protein|nr:hypothetical protein [Solirubrobacterales bacterium]